MKILHVIPSVLPSQGGVREVAFGLARGLIKRGINAEIAGSGVGRPKSGDKIVTHEFSSYLKKVFPPNFFYSPGIKNWMRFNLSKFNLVHVHGLFNYPGYQACKFAQKKGIPYVLSPCGMLAPWALKRSKIKKKIWFSLYENYNLSKAKILHFTSEQEKADSHNLDIPTRGVVVPIGINNIYSHGIGPTQFLKDMFGELEGRIKVLFFSRIHPKKGLELLIHGLKILYQKRKDFVFILSGGGESSYEREINGLIDRLGLREITFKTGFVDKSDKAFVLSQSDLFVLPSYHENFGIAVAEALGYGLPVLISNNIDIHQDIERSNAGIIIRMDPEDIASAIENLLDNPFIRKKMGGNGKKLALKKYNWDVIIPQMIRHYEKIISGRN